jgi:cation:H+ antiporter
MAIGNIIWSNIFNIVRIIGLCSVVRPVPVATSLNIDMMVLAGVTFLLWIVLYTNKKQSLNRTHGIIMICLYACYLGFLLWRG